MSEEHVIQQGYKTAFCTASPGLSKFHLSAGYEFTACRPHPIGTNVSRIRCLNITKGTFHISRWISSTFQRTFIKYPLKRGRYIHSHLKSKQKFLLQITRTNRSCWSAGRSQSRTTQFEQATQHWRLLPRSCCSNHGPVDDVLARRTSLLDYAVCQRNFCLDYNMNGRTWLSCDSGYWVALNLMESSILCCLFCRKYILEYFSGMKLTILRCCVKSHGILSSCTILIGCYG